MSKVLIIGGGAAGMFAAITAARNGHEVSIFEKNEKLGKKLFITGKGRCNITNACDMETLGNACTYDAMGFVARACCHEIDHLDGILFYDKEYTNVYRRVIR